MSQAVVEVRNLAKKYHVRHERMPSIKRAVVRVFRPYPTEVLWALRDVSFSAGSGESVGIIGSNGSGKSTLLRLIAGILVPTDGEITVRGAAGGLFELAAGFHPELSGADNILLSGALMGYSRRQVEDRYQDIVAFSELADFIDVPVKTYSSGMSLRLGFATAIAFEPQVLLVDEVLAVADEHFQRKAYGHLARLRDKGSTLFMVSHELASIERHCTRAIWLEKGKIRADGPTEEVVGAYLAEQGNGNATG